MVGWSVQGGARLSEKVNKNAVKIPMSYVLFTILKIHIKISKLFFTIYT